MVGPVAQAYLDALWALSASKLVDQAQVEAMAYRVDNDAQLTDVERASLLGMLRALARVGPVEDER